MPDEEKAEEYVENKYHCNQSECIQGNSCDYCYREESKRSYLDGLAEGRQEVREHETTFVNRLHHIEKKNEELKNKNFVATQLYNNALTENKGLKDIITELRKENKQLQTRFHIVPEHYLTEALDKCKELEEKVKGFESGNVAWQGDMDATIQQNMELKAQIEKMKCCVNCKFFDGCAGDYLKRGFRKYVDELKQTCDKWEMAE